MADDDALVLLMMNELHAHVPEGERPMSMSDLSDEQAARARAAVRAVLAASRAERVSGEPMPRLTEEDEDTICEWFTGAGPGGTSIPPSQRKGG